LLIASVGPFDTLACGIDDPETAVGFVAQLGHDLQDDSCPPEINQLGRTLIRWHSQIVAWHQ
jgi:hypothetical protein